MFVIALPAAAADLVVSRAILEDKAGTLTIEQVAGREFTPVGPTLSRGFTNSVHWLRLQVRKPAKGSEAVLYMRQPYLNEIRLFESDPANPTGWKSRVTGNSYPYKERDRVRSTLGFVVNMTTPETTYYLRLKTRSPSHLRVEALEPGEAEHSDDQLDVMEVFFVTSMMLLLLWALHSYLLDRLLIVGLFAVHQAVYTLYGVAITGYLAPIIPAGFPQLADWTTFISYCAITFTTLLFCRELFKPYNPPLLLMRGLDIFLLAFPIQLAAIALGFNTFAVNLNYVLIRVIWWYLVVMVFSLRREQSPSRRMLQLFFVTITVVFTFFWVVNSNEGLMNEHKILARQILIANGLIIGGIFAMILNARSRRLQQEAKQSAQELQAKSEFLALVSHEIRTPLNALIGFSTLARKTNDPVKLNEYLDILEQSSGSLKELVNDILDMSKIEAGRMTLEDAPFNLHRLLNDLEGQYRPLAAQKQLAFHFELAEDVPVWVMGDVTRLRQILANLLANAVKFTEHGSASCAVSMVGKAGRFEVRDTGIGIPEENQTQLFKSFHQLDPGIARRFGGTGLGLVIVRNLTEMMNGSITFVSREGAGSCFTVELPLRETDAVPTADVEVVTSVAGEFLVVEDNNFNRRLLQDILTSWGGSVTLATDGLQALQLIEEQSFDLILLDIRMPGIDGIEVARRIRRREQALREPSVPIIAITAETDAVTREACLGAGINAVLAKPVNPAQLGRVIGSYAKKTAGPAPVGELLLNAQISNDLGDNRERARQYRELLRQDINDELQALQSALESDNRDDFGRAAHTLKGLCGHLADSEPAALADWLQHNAESAGPEQLRPVLEHLVTILACNPIQENSL